MPQAGEIFIHPSAFPISTFFRQSPKRPNSQKHPSIEFRSTPAGRMAYVRGVRLAVWLAVETVEDCGGNTRKAARLLRLPGLLLQAALAYARAFSNEIAANRAAGTRPLEELDTLVSNHSFFRV